MTPSQRHDAGIALLVVLWFLVAMSGLAAAIAGIGRDTAFAARNAIASIEARAAIAGAVEIAAASIRQGNFAPSGMMEWQQGDMTIQIVAIAENSKIDLNGASDDLIEGLAAAAVSASGKEAAEGLALGHAILDWRDPDQNRRLAGAEASDYGKSSKPRDGPFAFVAELRSVMGMDDELFALLAPAVTVHHGADEPSVGPASQLVRDAIDRARGMAPRGDTEGSSTFDSAQSLDDTDDERISEPFVDDPNGLYTLDITVIHDDGPTHRHETVIWIDQTVDDRQYAILESRSGVLSSSTLQSMISGELPWTER